MVDRKQGYVGEETGLCWIENRVMLDRKQGYVGEETGLSEVLFNTVKSCISKLNGTNFFFSYVGTRRYRK